MPKIGSMFESKYLKSADIPEGSQVQVTIERVEIENVARQGTPPENKPVIYFQGKKRGFVLNKTNAKVIQKITGSDDTDHWPGHSIVLYSTEVSFGDEMVPAIRIKPAKPAQRAATAPAVPSTNGGASRPAPTRPAMQMAGHDEPEGGSGEDGPDAETPDDCPF